MLRHKSNYAVDRVQGWAPKRESATTLVGAGGHGWGRGRQCWLGWQPLTKASTLVGAKGDGVGRG